MKPALVANVTAAIEALIADTILDVEDKRRYVAVEKLAKLASNFNALVGLRIEDRVVRQRRVYGAVCADPEGDYVGGVGEEQVEEDGVVLGMGDAIVRARNQVQVQPADAIREMLAMIPEVVKLQLKPKEQPPAVRLNDLLTAREALVKAGRPTAIVDEEITKAEQALRGPQDDPHEAPEEPPPVLETSAEEDAA